jgi:hypothetical protein
LYMFCTGNPVVYGHQKAVCIDVGDRDCLKGRSRSKIERWERKSKTYENG